MCIHLHCIASLPCEPLHHMYSWSSASCTQTVWLSEPCCTVRGLYWGRLWGHYWGQYVCQCTIDDYVMVTPHILFGITAVSCIGRYIQWFWCICNKLISADISAWPIYRSSYITYACLWWENGLCCFVCIYDMVWTAYENNHHSFIITYALCSTKRNLEGLIVNWQLLHPILRYNNFSQPQWRPDISSNGRATQGVNQTNTVKWLYGLPTPNSRLPQE